MSLSLEETKLVGLTMKLNLKAKEYKELCKELDELEQQGIDPNDERLRPLLSKFKQNNSEIKSIKRQLHALQ